MAVNGNLIQDFLDASLEHRIEGVYCFDEHEEKYLSEIPQDLYFSRVVEAPTEIRKGKVEILFRDIEVKDVFSITHASSISYVERSRPDSAMYEATFSLALEEPGRTMILHGPSKVGKSAMWKRTIGSEAIVVSCTPAASLQDHYHDAMFGLKSSFVAEEEQEQQQGDQNGVEMEVAVGKKDVAQGKVKVTRDKSSGEASKAVTKFVDQPISASTLSKDVVQSGKVLVFENFHRLDEQVFDELCFDLRTFEDARVTTVLVGIPADPYRFASVNSELIGRTVSMHIDFWSKEDLKSIARNGQIALNITFSDESLEMLSLEAAGSPLLMQLYSFIGCIASDIVRTQGYQTEVEITHSDLGIGMNLYGRLYLESCAAIWDVLENAAKSIRSLPNGFHAALLERLRKGDPTLAFHADELSCNSIKTRGLTALVNRLNRRELTRDLLKFDPYKRTIQVANPLAVAYARWLV